MEEIWKTIDGTLNRHEVSNFGNIKKDGKPYKTGVKPNGYWQVSIGFIFGRRTIELHRLVVAYFCNIPQDYDNLQVNHIDGDKSNNRVDNLEWCTPKGNQQHRINVLGKHMRGDKNPMYGVSGAKSPVFKGYVYQINPDTKEVIGKYEGGREASQKTGFHMTNIYRAISKGVKYHNFLWERHL